MEGAAPSRANRGGARIDSWPRGWRPACNRSACGIVSYTDSISPWRPPPGSIETKKPEQAAGGRLPRAVDSTQTRGAFKRRWLSWFLAAGAVVLGGAGLLWWRAGSQGARSAHATGTRGTVRRSVNTTGALNPVVTVQVGSYVSGPVKTLKCDFTTAVVAGHSCAQTHPV